MIKVKHFVQIVLALFSTALMAQNQSDAVVLDVEHNKYLVVAVGSQIWMAEDLKTSHYSNGDPILPISSSDLWANTDSGAFFTISSNDSKPKPYCFLYNWFAVADSRNICPVGWHVPSVTEWNTLDSALSGNIAALRAVFSGYLSANEGLEDVGDKSRWWTATRVPHEGGRGAFYRALKRDKNKIYKGSFNRVSGCSVRCVKN